MKLQVTLIILLILSKNSFETCYEKNGLIYINGWSQLNEDEDVYYQFRCKGCTQDNLFEKPLLIYLAGEPGESSQLTNLFGIGEFNLIQLDQESDQLLLINEFTWLKSYSLLFIEFPLGSGISELTSYKHIPSDSQTIYNQFMQIYSNIMEHPCFNSQQYKEVVLVGKGTAAKYVLDIANNNIDKKLINIKAIALSSPMISTFTVVSEIGNFLQQESFINQDQRIVIEKKILIIRSFMVKEQFNNAHQQFDQLFRYVLQQTQIQNIFNFMIQNPYHFYRQMDTYFENGFNKILLNISNIINFGQFQYDVQRNLYDYFIQDHNKQLENILSQTDINVLIYQGENNLFVNKIGLNKSINQLQWKYSQEFKNLKFKDIIDENGKIIGEMKQQDKLQLRIYKDCGHYFEFEKPQLALQMIQELLKQQ